MPDGTRARRRGVLDDSPVNWCTGEVLSAAIAVHDALGPGLLESAYRLCLVHELRGRGLAVRTEVTMPLRYRGVRLQEAYRLDLLVGELVVVEIKALPAVRPVHRAQLLSYLKLSGYPVGMLLNFHEQRLMDGYSRLVNKL